MFITILATLFTYINAPVTDMRAEPSSDSRVASQAYYSEPIEIVEEQPEWTLIQTSDGYRGWAKKSAFYQSTQKYIDNPNALVAKINRCTAHVYGVNDTEFGPIKTLPFESRLEVLDQFNEPNGRWLKVRMLDGTIAYVQRGDITLNQQPLSRDDMIALSSFFLNLPYTWGGRSSFGYDCSGFVQMLYRQMGIAIPRDSRQQAAWEGFREVALEEMTPGDLVFFGVEAPKITHVGMYLGQGKFIHSAVLENKPYIHVSNLQDADWNGTGRLKNRVARTLIR